MRRLKQSVLVLLAVFAVAQLIRPDRTNPPLDPTRGLPARLSSLAPIVDRSCGDCHSNATVWPWYTQVAPVSWLMTRGVSEGRSAVNFSEWVTYSPNQQRTLLAASCDDVSSGRMPGPWTRLHPETKLSPQDIAIICAAARQVKKEEP